MDVFRVVLAGYRMRDHGARSGYVHLARLLGQRGATVLLGGRWQWTIGLPLRFGLPFSGMPLYNVFRLADEIRVMADMRGAAPTLYHFLYGEAGFRHAGRPASRHGHRLVATFHLPAEGLHARIRSTKHLRFLSAVICVAQSQFAFFEEVAPDVPRYHIPLGVDCAFFTPGERGTAGPRLICVGEHLRDWRTLLRVYRHTKAIHPDTTLTVVTPPAGFAHDPNDRDVRVLRRLSDAELRDAYRGADLLVLPLHDATASNTVLEAMACGLPVVTTRHSSMLAYVGGEAGLFCERGNAEEMAAAVLSLLDDSTRRGELAARSRIRAESFDWNRICDRTEAVYASVMR